VQKSKSFALSLSFSIGSKHALTYSIKRQPLQQFTYSRGFRHFIKKTAARLCPPHANRPQAPPVRPPGSAYASARKPLRSAPADAGHRATLGPYARQPSSSAPADAGRRAPWPPRAPATELGPCGRRLLAGTPAINTRAHTHEHKESVLLKCCSVF
jgi:hypothetical protein